MHHCILQHITNQKNWEWGHFVSISSTLHSSLCPSLIPLWPILTKFTQYENVIVKYFTFYFLRFTSRMVYDFAGFYTARFWIFMWYSNPVRLGIFTALKKIMVSGMNLMVLHHKPRGSSNFWFVMLAKITPKRWARNFKMSHKE